MTAIPQRLIDCFGSVHWRLSNLYYITDKEGKRVKFEPNWAQQDLLDHMWYQNIILKARQLGFTTFIQLFMLDACVFNSNVRAGVVAHRLDDATTIFRDKIKFPYDNLPEGIKDAVHPKRDSALELELSNNSAIRVGTSHRSGTLQYLHVSEYGKLCAQYPEKAQEVRTGALNTVQAGQFVFIESTAEGQSGDFYDKCQLAQQAQARGEKLTELDFKFFFFPWWRHPDYVLEHSEGLAIPGSFARYFAELQAKGIILTPAQQAWYVKKAEQQGSDMKREFPSTPEEAFEAAIEGAYYSEQMAKADSEGRITNVPHDPHAKVEVIFDLGRHEADSMALGFKQVCGQELHWIHSYANSGEGFPHYASYLQRMSMERGYVYSRIVMPWDIKITELTTNKTRLEVAERIFSGIPIKVAPDLSVADGIEQVRGEFHRYWFDKSECEGLIKSARAYQHEWNDNLGTWRDHPLKNWASHYADMLRYSALTDPPKKWAPIVYPPQHVSRGFI
jgi:hypothetical protein